MDFTDLTPIADRMMNKLSKGMAQRLCLGRTLLHDPDVLILDEPAAGLDPKARVEFKQLVRLLAGEGKTIFISSHILSELAEMCDTMLFIDGGALVHHGSAESLQHRQDGAAVFDIHVHGAPEALTHWVEVNPGVRLVDTHKRGARVSFDVGRARGRQPRISDACCKTACPSSTSTARAASSKTLSWTCSGKFEENAARGKRCHFSALSTGTR